MDRGQGKAWETVDRRVENRWHTLASPPNLCAGRNPSPSSVLVVPPLAPLPPSPNIPPHPLPTHLHPTAQVHQPGEGVVTHNSSNSTTTRRSTSRPQRGVVDRKVEGQALAGRTRLNVKQTHAAVVVGGHHTVAIVACTRKVTTCMHAGGSGSNTARREMCASRCNVGVDKGTRQLVPLTTDCNSCQPVHIMPPMHTSTPQTHARSDTLSQT